MYAFVLSEFMYPCVHVYVYMVLTENLFCAEWLIKEGTEFKTLFAFLNTKRLVVLLMLTEEPWKMKDI